nr:MAG TPA: hypothetical protein [Caudoviricetes sp.]DAJ64222.1 MAG TPA: hypothetical protein [Bacteriophage sp.]
MEFFIANSRFKYDFTISHNITFLLFGFMRDIIQSAIHNGEEERIWIR